VTWNCDKHYLAELADRDVALVPTEFFERGADPQRLAATLHDRGWNHFVLKPAISAASFATRSFAANETEAAMSFLAEKLRHRAMLVQPFLSSTRTVGEKSIAWIDGAITHAWIKRPRFAGEDERVEPTTAITPADRELVARAIAGIPIDGVFYARVDVMYSDEGHPLLSELELIEPSLHFRFSQQSLDRFAAGLIEQIGSRVSPERVR
jgi:hypothetical protein